MSEVKLWLKAFGILLIGVAVVAGMCVAAFHYPEVYFSIMAVGFAVVALCSIKYELSNRR